MSESTKRFYYIDLLKTIAMFFVLSYHTMFYDYDIISDGSALNYVHYFGSTILATCVPLFFFASGYLLFSKELNLKKHIIKTIRFIILTAIWSALILAVSMPIKGEWLTRREFLRSIFQLKDEWNNHLWFMYVLIGIYVIFPLLKLLHDKNKVIFHAFVIIYAGFIASLVSINVIATFTYHLRSFTLANIAFDGTLSGVFFWIGGLVYDHRKKLISIPVAFRNKCAVISILVSGCLLGILGIKYSKIGGELWDVVFCGYNTVMTLVSVLAIFALALNYQRDNKTIHMISVNTLGIYFLHMPIIRLVKPWIIKVPYLNTMWFTAIFAVVILIICAWLAETIKKIPVIKYLLM